MIAEMVTLKPADDMNWDEAAADARSAFEHWTDFPGLVRKHFLYGGNGHLYGFYVWESRQASEEGHNEAWRQNVIKRTGNPPVSQYFGVMATVDNQRGVVEEFALPEMAAE
jgi:hypothetical protein